MTIQTNMECKKFSYSGTWKSIRNGQKRMAIECPYCKTVVYVFVWSLEKNGKKCKCGAKHTHTGESYRIKGKVL